MGRMTEFLSTFKGESTVRAYRAHLKRFFKLLYPTEKMFSTKGIKISDDVYDKYVEKYLEARNYRVKDGQVKIDTESIMKDVESFFITLKGRPASSIAMTISAVKNFLEDQRVELPRVFWKRLKRRIGGSRTLTQDYVPNASELKRILTHMNLKGRALFLFLESSGARIGEVLQLELDDIDLNHDPPRITIRGSYTKTGNPRITFISLEAKEVLLEWLKVRSQYLLGASRRGISKDSKRGTQLKPIEDKRIFPYEGTTALGMWYNACSKAGFDKRDKETNRYEVHPHVLRKYFRSKMGEVIPVDIVEALMGHSGYLTEVYRRHSEKDVAEYYRKGENKLLVFSDVGDISKIRQEVSTQVSSQMDGITADNVKLKDMLKHLDERMKRYESFTKKFMELTPDELQELSEAIQKKRVSET